MNGSHIVAAKERAHLGVERVTEVFTSANDVEHMNRKHQIIATHDALPADRSPMDAVKSAINALTVGPPHAFIAIDALRPYPFRDIGGPDWLLVSASADQPTFIHTDWRKVIEAAPQEALVVLLSQGGPSNVPREVVRHVDLTGWQALLAVEPLRLFPVDRDAVPAEQDAVVRHCDVRSTHLSVTGREMQFCGP